MNCSYCSKANCGFKPQLFCKVSPKNEADVAGRNKNIVENMSPAPDLTFFGPQAF